MAEQIELLNEIIKADNEIIASYKRSEKAYKNIISIHKRLLGNILLVCNLFDGDKAKEIIKKNVEKILE